MSAVSENFRGAILMMVSAIAYTVNDAIVKLVSDNLGIYQIMLIRGIIATLILGAMAWHAKAIFPKLDKKDWLVVSYRMIGEIGGTLCFLTALFNLPLATATSILQSIPLAITLAAAMFLNEPVGWRRYMAIIVGFIGVMIIVRPGFDGFDVNSLWVLAAVAFIVLRDLATRQLPTHIPSIFTALLTALVIAITGAILAPTATWQPVSLVDVELLGLAAVFLIGGYLFGIMTMRIGEISFISPFRYTALIWAGILGFVVFNDTPDNWTLFGSAIVILTGMYTFYRENKIKHQAQLVDSVSNN